MSKKKSPALTGDILGVGPVLIRNGEPLTEKNNAQSIVYYKRERWQNPSVAHIEQSGRVIYTARGIRVTGQQRQPEPEPEDEPESTEKADVPKRGEVAGLSSKSAARLIWLMSGLSLFTMSGIHGMHMTVTVGGEYIRNAQHWKRIINSFRKALLRLDLIGLWRLEFQDRGAPHWHLLLWWMDDCPYEFEAIQEKAREAWARLSGNDSAAGVHFSGCNERAAWYLACHHGKGSQGRWPAWYTGRAWGFVNEPAVMEWFKETDAGRLDCPHELLWMKRVYLRFVSAAKRRQYARALEHWRTNTLDTSKHKNLKPEAMVTISNGRETRTVRFSNFCKRCNKYAGWLLVASRPVYRRYKMSPYATGYRMHMAGAQHTVGALVACVRSLAQDSMMRVAASPAA